MAELPSGTVTFLLTDVEGSTALWEEAPEAMRAALARHDSLFEQVIQERGTLTGPGGTGKTRLGLQIAAELLDDFEHGVFLVELAPIFDPALVPSSIAQALGVRDVGSRPIVDALKDYLRARSVVLLLDNFEQILPAASLVADLLTSCPDVAVLATSREPLRLRGEHEYAVSPLALPTARALTTVEAVSRSPAVALFVQRARAIRADFALTAENAPAVADICASLDGLPLAIELAAARVRLLAPEAMARRLERRLPVLVGGARDLPARQQTLRGAIDWSHDLLDERERRLFRRLGVFVGGWTLDAAEAVCDADGDLDTLGGLESLASKSLVKQDADARGEPRFGMLETIREYALERLEASGEATPMRRRHAEHFLALAEEAEPHLERAEAGAWLDRLQVEHDNVRAAVSWGAEHDADVLARLAGAVRQFWWRRGDVSEGQGWIDRALSRPIDPAPRIKLLSGAASLAYFQHQYPRARELWTERAERARASGDQAALAQTLARLAHLTQAQGDFEQAVAFAEESLAISRALGDDESMARSLSNRAAVALSMNDLDLAWTTWEESLRLFRKVGLAILVAHTLNNLGMVAIRLGDLAKATVLCNEGYELFRQRDDRFGMRSAAGNLMRIAFRQGDVDLATSRAREYLILGREFGSSLTIADGLQALAWAADTRGDAGRAARLLGAADAIRAPSGALIGAAQRDVQEAAVTAAQNALGNEAFTAAWAEGRAMTLEQAVAYALDESPSA